MSVAIFGAGWLGQRLAAALPGARLVRADITDPAAIDRALAQTGAAAAINAAGKTGRPNIDWCERHPVETIRANVGGAVTLAAACAERGVYLLQLGSGCIFYGPSPRPGGWREDDFANPASLYSRSKYAADLALSRLPGVGIARIRLPLDDRPHPRNLIDKLTRYPEVIDVENSVTVIPEMLDVVGALVDRRARGVFHVTNPGAVSHREILAQYRAHVAPDHACAFIPESALLGRGLVAARRSNCVLASDRLADLGIAMTPIGRALPSLMARYGAAKRSA